MKGIIRLRRAIKANDVNTLEDVLSYISVRDWFKRARMNPYGPAMKRIADPKLFTIYESDKLAKALGITCTRMMGIIVSSLTSSLQDPVQ